MDPSLPFIMMDPSFPSLSADDDRPPKYSRGAPSPLVRQLGNPYIVLTPLRAALFSHLGYRPDIPVTESFPVWDKQLGEARFEQQVRSGRDGAGDWMYQRGIYVDLCTQLSFAN
jgi:hypothetical protein